jgi:hypothetical protein
MRRARIVGVATAALLAFSLPTVAVAAESPAPTPPGGDNCIGVCPGTGTVVTGAGEGFGIKQHRKPSEHVPGRGDLAKHVVNGKQVWTTTEEYITPMCSYNGLHGADVMCMEAATYCQDGRVGFWVWHQVTTHTRDEQGNETTEVGSWKQEDGAFCLGADDPGVPTIGKVISQVQDLFLQNDIGILPLAVKAAPAPKTLVNMETRFSAGSGDVVDIAVPTAWANVVIHAKPVRWRWTFGDATAPQVTTVPTVTHIYRHPGVLSNVHVDVEWGGTFSIVGDPTAYPIVGTAMVPGTNITVDVREARSELVSH